MTEPEPHELVTVPAGLLMTTGGIQLVYGLFWTTMGALSVAGQGIQLVMMLVEQTVQPLVALLILWGAMVGSVQLLFTGAMVVTGAAALRGGVSLWQLDRARTVRIGAAAAIVGPVLVMVGNCLGVLSFNLIGLFCGSFGPLLLLAAGMISAVTAFNAADRKEVALHFEDARRLE